ncbi:MAG: dephospho-CoA kinase [Bacteroidales bacterium]|jgi:dephospho-CoA kinase|nr:dephospho-CoA kinase [Bacteroidales bacterium]
MLKIGVTGGIGSGKTTVCRLFETLGIPVYYADDRAKELMDTDPELKNLLQQHFGNDLYRNGKLDRPKLSEFIFNNRTQLQTVNGWVHPAVARDFELWCTRQTSPYVMEESAILFESNSAVRFDKIILVVAPEDMRIERVCLRDNIDSDSVRRRMSNQWSEKKKRELADFVICNDNKHALLPQVEEIHGKLHPSAEK